MINCINKCEYKNKKEQLSYDYNKTQLTNCSKTYIS